MARERRNWTSKEDELLEQAVEQARSASQTLQWSTIAASVPGRTNKDCRKRYYYKVSATINKGTWTKSEDDSLRAAVQKYGPKWTRVAVEVGTRSGDQCSKRWNNTLDPAIDQSAWSIRDTKTLLRCVEQQGHNWKSIVADYFPGRTALSARNQYNYMCRRSGVNGQPSTPSSLQSTSSSLHRNRSGTQSGRPSLAHSTETSSETILESEEDQSDFMDDSSSEDDDEEDGQPNHPSLPNEPAKVSDYVGLMGLGPESPPEMETLWPVTSSNGIPQYPSMDQMFPNQAAFGASQPSPFLQSPFPDDFAAQTHASLSEPPSAFYGLPTTNLAEVPAPTRDSTVDRTTKKTVTITATCSRAEIQRLMQMTAQELQYIDFSVTSSQRNSKPTGQRSRLGDTKHVVITATCPAKELGRLMEMASDTLGSVSFSVCPSVDKAI